MVNGESLFVDYFLRRLLSCIRLLPIPPQQFPTRHPNLLWIRPISRTLKQTTQPLFIVEHQKPIHEETIKPRLEASWPLAQRKAEARRPRAQQRQTIKRMQISRKTWCFRPGGQGT